MAKANAAQAEAVSKANRNTKARTKNAGKRPDKASASPAAPKARNGASISKTLPADAGKAETHPTKAKKPKIVRDSFTMPEAEYAQIARLKQACLAVGISVKKSELLRAGIAMLSELSPDALKRTVLQIESIKTGRPAGKAKRSKDERNKT